MPSAERTRKSPNSLDASTTAGLFAFFALKPSSSWPPRSTGGQPNERNMDPFWSGFRGQTLTSPWHYKCLLRSAPGNCRIRSASVRPLTYLRSFARRASGAGGEQLQANIRHATLFAECQLS
jgi:hypothetical protein